MNVTIPYSPRQWSLEHLHNRKERWIVIVAHRRSGKTTAALNHLQRDALKIPNSKFAYIAPTYKQAKLIAWDMAKYYARSIPGIEFNEVELTVKYPNGSKLSLYGADNPDSLRGLGLWGVCFDEYSQQPSNIFSEIIRPALADHEGYAIWIGTPKGRNEFYRLYENGKDAENWHSVLLTVDDTDLIKVEELADAKKIMSADEFQQEWYCSFSAAIKGAIYAVELADARKDKRIGVVPYDKSLLVHTVWDLGKGANMAVGFYQQAFGRLQKIDYWEGSGDEGLPEAIKVIKDEKPYVYGKHFAPHDIEAVEIGTGKTRLETAKELGINFSVIPKLSVEEGIHMARLSFSTLWVDEERCKFWLDYIAQYRREWDDKKGMFKDNPLHDFTSHAADEWRYAAVIKDQMTNESDSVEPRWQEPNYDPFALK